ncbi:hypothetical protein PanWU01x14_176540 [Parasponia andersonii]|uniref:Uncharacterized protein n=1 Tax=Parasponia andersonii TaxID=3476 RepID=A0A2P5C7U4_PARAD|nr:hypothetical protein PanWU01x14_176540 [Parasponia andersonii]
MAVIPEQVVETVEEIMRTYKSLPPRPTIEEVEAAKSVIKTVDTEEQLKLDEISNQEVPKDVPRDLFSVLLDVRKTVVVFHSYEQRREARHIVELDRMFQIFDDLIQRASGLVSGDTQNQKRGNFSDPVEKIEREAVISDESLVKTKKKSREGEKVVERNVPMALERSSSAKASFYSGLV